MGMYTRTRGKESTRQMYVLSEPRESIVSLTLIRITREPMRNEQGGQFKDNKQVIILGSLVFLTGF